MLAQFEEINNPSPASHKRKNKRITQTCNFHLRPKRRDLQYNGEVKMIVNPFPMIFLETESEGVWSVEIVKEVAKDWRIPFLDFLQRDRLPDDFSKKAEIGR